MAGRPQHGYAAAVTNDDAAPVHDDPRSALKVELWGMGVADDQAEAWISRWVAAAADLGIAHDDPAYWRLASAWIDEHRPAD